MEAIPEILDRVTVSTNTQGRPLGDRVLVLPLPEDEVTSGGIIIPDMAKTRPQMGEVVAVGPGRTIINEGEMYVVPIDLEPGQMILYSQYSGVDIKIDGEEMTILNNEDILMIVETKPGKAEAVAPKARFS